MIALEAPLARLLNHLLEGEAWARERLAPFAGSAVELRAPPAPPLRLAIAPDGRLRPAAEEASPALVMTLGPQILPALLQGEAHLVRAVDATGDARLANELLFLFRHLRWDAEEDLARLVGDAAAHRILLTLRQVGRWNREALERVSANVLDHALEEERSLAQRRAFEEHRGEVGQLRDALERLEKRVGRLGG